MRSMALILAGCALASLISRHSVVGQCDLESQWESLSDLWNVTGGPWWTYENPTAVEWAPSSYVPSGCKQWDVKGEKLVDLPGYCCWDGVSCCTDPFCPPSKQYLDNANCNCTPGIVSGLQLRRHNLTGNFPGDPLVSLQCTGFFRNLNFQQNLISGTLPSLVGDLDGLWYFILQSNQLVGTLPEEFNKIYSLKVLDVGWNQMTGPISPSLCNTNVNRSNLKSLIIRNNNFSGNYSVPGCNSMINLDAVNNSMAWGDRFDHSIGDPLFLGYDILHFIGMPSNLLTGTILTPTNSEAPITSINLNNNRITGQIPEDYKYLTFATSLQLFNNSINGTIPSILYRSLGSLVVLNVGFNWITGTISPEIGSLQSLEILSFFNNSIYGSIPNEMGKLDFLNGTIIDLRYNFLFCCGGEYTGDALYGSYSSINLNEEDLLPDFLMFSPPEFNTPPTMYDDNSTDLMENMRCPRVLTKGSVAERGLYVEYLLDPMYYGYRHCFCVEGYEMIDITGTLAEFGNIPTYGCFKENLSWWEETPALLAVAIIVPILLVLLGLAWWFCFRQDARPKFVQWYFNMKKRTQGEPTGGTVSVVVTSIEDYTRLLIEYQDEMMKAIAIHSNVIEKAVWSSFASTIEQDITNGGYALVFHEAMDAVVFCLHAQLALMRQDWPRGIMGAAGKGGTSKKRWSKIFMSRLSKLNFIKKIRKPRSSNGSKRNSTNLILEESQLTRELQQRVTSSNRLPAVRRGLANSSYTTRGGPSMTAISAASIEDLSVLGGSRTSDASAELTGNNDPALFRGLRAKMGITTGELASGHSIKGSKIHQIAQIISNASNGGQVLMDAPTFAAIKERLEELIAVDHNGLNSSKLASKNIKKWAFWGLAPKQALEDETPVLDMGTYVYSLLCQVPITVGVQMEKTHQGNGVRKDEQCSTCADDASERGSGPNGSEAASNDACSVASESERKSAAYHQQKGKTLSRSMVMTQSFHMGKARNQEVINLEGEELHLYQILPSCLVQRAKVFENKLALDPEWVVMDQPYFSAPGTKDAPIGLVSADAALDLPPITMIFCIIDGGKSYAARFRRDARVVHDVCASVIRNTLREVPGGYLCRLQDGDLKYMVAVPTAQLALAWCIMLQECLMYADWPASALVQWPEERCPNTGQLVFRGPRMKIGVCEGPPRSILPDHLGHADYHGASINQSARYMDAGAHGGQIVCEEATAIQALHVFQQEYDMLRNSRLAAERAYRPPLPSTSEARTPATLPSGCEASDQLPTLEEEKQAWVQTILGGVAAEGGLAELEAGTSEGRDDPMSSLHLVSFNPLHTSSTVHLPMPPCQNELGSSALTPAKAEVSPTCYAAQSLGTAADATTKVDGERCSPSPGPAEPLLTDPEVSELSSAPPDPSAAPEPPAPSSSAPAANMGVSVRASSITDLPKSRSILRTGGGGGGGGGFSLLNQRPARVLTFQNSSRRGDQHDGMLMREVSDYNSDSEASIEDSNDPLPLLHKSYTTQVSAHRTGVFQFKGNKEPIKMVHVISAQLASRKFPSDPPKGKGNRLSEASGLVMEADVPLSDIVLRYREHWKRKDDEDQACRQPLSSPVHSPNTVGVGSTAPDEEILLDKSVRETRAGVKNVFGRKKVDAVDSAASAAHQV